MHLQQWQSYSNRTVSFPFLVELFCINFSLNISIFLNQSCILFFLEDRGLSLPDGQQLLLGVSVAMLNGMVIISLLVQHWDYGINAEICGLVTGTAAITRAAC